MVETLDVIIVKCACGSVKIGEKWGDYQVFNNVKISHGVCSNECAIKYYGVDLN